jgi:hypothetical protein
MEIKLPVKTKVEIERSDAFQDLNIRLDQLLNFIGEVLVLRRLAGNKIDEDITFIPEIRDRIIDKKVESPSIELISSKWNSLRKDLWEQLFYSSITRLLTAYEVFWSELLKEVLFRNFELLMTKDKQFSNEEIFAKENIEELKAELVDKKIKAILINSYPMLSKKITELLKIEFHGSKSPMSLMEMHDLFEVRNMIVHGDGYGEGEYEKRMGGYIHYEDCYLYGEYGVKLNYKWLFVQIEAVRNQCLHINQLVNKNWKTSEFDYKKHD